MQGQLRQELALCFWSTRRRQHATLPSMSSGDSDSAALRAGLEPSLSEIPATAFSIIVAIGICHMLNDMMQSLLPAIYPDIKRNLGLNFAQIGIITLVNQATASLLQPFVGLYADRRPTPLALP